MLCHPALSSVLQEAFPESPTDRCRYCAHSLDLRRTSHDASCVLESPCHSNQTLVRWIEFRGTCPRVSTTDLLVTTISFRQSSYHSRTISGESQLSIAEKVTSGLGHERSACDVTYGQMTDRQTSAAVYGCPSYTTVRRGSWISHLIESM